MRVRRAIAHAIDRKFLVEKFQAGVTKPLEGPLPPDHLFASTDLVHYAYDLKEANRILDEAGYKPDANGVRFKATLDAPTYSPDGLGRVADYLKPQLKKIGIEIDRRISPDTATWAQRLSNYDYDIGMSQIYNYPDPVIGTHRLFLCKNQIKGVIFSNTGGYCNERSTRIRSGVERGGLHKAQGAVRRVSEDHYRGPALCLHDDGIAVRRRAEGRRRSAEDRARHYEPDVGHREEMMERRRMTRLPAETNI